MDASTHELLQKLIALNRFINSHNYLYSREQYIREVELSVIKVGCRAMTPFLLLCLPAAANANKQYNDLGMETSGNCY